MKAWMVAVPVVVMFVGCVTEQERIARIAAEKARQEQIAQEAKEREEREAKERKEREEREARERIETYHQRIEAYWSDLANDNAELILSTLDSKNKRKLRRSDLKNWLKPRNGISPESAAEGEALLEEFGTKYMPNAYTNYEKARLSAQEFQSFFNDIYPSGTPSSLAATNAFYKAIKGFSTARTRYFRYRDELCHYYIMNKVGAMNMEELSHIDNGKIWIRLLEEVPKQKITDRLKEITMDQEMMDLTHGRESSQLKMDDRLNTFAAKYAPEMSELHRKCIEELSLMEKTYSELTKDIRILDVVRYEMGEMALCLGIVHTRSLCNSIVTKLTDWQMQHMSMDMTAEQISKLSHETAVKLKNDGASIGNWVAQRANGPMILNDGPILDWHWGALGFASLSTDIDVPSFFSEQQQNAINFHGNSQPRGLLTEDKNVIKLNSYDIKNDIKIAYLIRFYRKDAYHEPTDRYAWRGGRLYKTDDCPFIVRLNEVDFDKGKHRITIINASECTSLDTISDLLSIVRVQFTGNKQKATSKEAQND